MVWDCLDVRSKDKKIFIMINSLMLTHRAIFMCGIGSGWLRLIFGGGGLFV